MSSNAAILLCNSYRRKIAWGGPDLDQDAALQETINSVYSMRKPEERADLYARLIEGGFTKNKGITSRRLIATTHIRSWDIARARGKIPKPEVKKEFSL